MGLTLAKLKAHNLFGARLRELPPPPSEMPGNTLAHANGHTCAHTNTSTPVCLKYKAANHKESKEKNDTHEEMHVQSSAAPHTHTLANTRATDLADLDSEGGESDGVSVTSSVEAVLLAEQEDNEAFKSLQREVGQFYEPQVHVT